MAIVLLLVLDATIHNLDSAQSIVYYRLVGDRTLVVATVTGHGAWTRVTGLSETPSTVTITVSSFIVQIGAGTAEGVPVESTVTLHEPLGGRTVVDGSSGEPVRETQCVPPPDTPTACF